MPKAPEKTETVSQQDWEDLDLPEWTDETFDRAVPFKDAHPEFYLSWKLAKNRPRVEEPDGTL